MPAPERVHSMTVVFRRDLTPTEAEQMAEAFRLFRLVSAVGFNVSDHYTYVAREQIRAEVKASILEILDRTS